MVSIDGTDISGATIDGTAVQEITIDGTVAWTAFSSETTTFNYTGSTQTYVIPNGANKIDIEATGGAGASGFSSAGEGGIIEGTVNVSGGETIYMDVGGQANGASGGWPDGGDSGTGVDYGNGVYDGAGGGGGSHIWMNGTTDSDLICAVGGGGGGTGATGRDIHRGGGGYGTGKWTSGVDAYNSAGGNDAPKVDSENNPAANGAFEDNGGKKGSPSFTNVYGTRQKTGNDGDRTGAFGPTFESTNRDDLTASAGGGGGGWRGGGSGGIVTYQDADIWAGGGAGGGGYVSGLDVLSVADYGTETGDGFVTIKAYK
jgi:hypothetical protein